jgi:hypothetical protein
MFVRALAIERDLSRRILGRPDSKTLLREQHRYEKVVCEVAREYKNAMAAYLAAIRAILKQ